MLSRIRTRSIIKDNLRLLKHRSLSTFKRKSVERDGHQLFQEEVFSNDLFGTGNKRFPFLESMDYVNKRNISWIHSSFDGRVKHSSDYNLCLEANSCPDKNVVYQYISNDCKNIIDIHWNNQRIVDMKNVLKEDKLFMEYIPQKYQDWCINMSARLFNGIPNVGNMDMELASCKWFMAAFITDDVLERLFGNNDIWNDIGRHFIHNMLHIFSGSHHHQTDAHKLFNIDSMKEKYVDIVPEALFDGLRVGQEIYLELDKEMKKLLSPKVYKNLCSLTRTYLSTYLVEQPKYRESNERRQHLDASDIQFSRVHSIGLICAFAPIITNQQVVHFNENDSVALALSWYCSKENDIIGAPRDKVGVDFCPISQINFIMNRDKIDMITAIKRQMREINVLRKSCEEIISSMDRKRRPVYERLQLFSHKVTDYCWANGINEVNSRYGWTPTLDDD